MEFDALEVVYLEVLRRSVGRQYAVLRATVAVLGVVVVVVVVAVVSVGLVVCCGSGVGGSSNNGVGGSSDGVSSMMW